jgi:hypothetical protein
MLLPNKLTTYGREKISKIINYDIDKLTEGNPVDLTAVSKITAGLYNNPDRIDIIQNLRDFGNEIATLIGIDIIPVKNLYKGISDEVDAIVNDPELSDIIKLNKITTMMPVLLKRELEALPDSNIDTLLKGSRIKPAALNSLYTPYVRLDSEGNLKVGDSTMIDGVSEEEYITAAHI